MTTTTLYDPHQLDVQDRHQILLALGRRWTQILLNLEDGNVGNWLDTYQAQTVTTLMAQPYAHPLLSAENVLDLMVGLDAALSAHERYERYGELDGEHQDYLGGMCETDALGELWADVESCVFRLLWATEPCSRCVQSRSWEDWNAGRPWCEPCHAKQRRVTSSMTDQRRLHAVGELS